MTGPQRISASGTLYRQACRNAWSCPSCSPYRLGRDADMIADVLLAHPGAVFATYTLQHQASTPLTQTLDALNDVWAHATGHGSWLGDFKKRTGLLGWAKVLEPEHGDTGWHPHFHVLWAFDRRPDDRALADLQTQWSRVAATRGHNGDRTDASRIPPGARREHAAHYATKGNALRRSDRPRTETIGDIAARVIEHADADALGLLLEYQSATFRRRRVTTSNGFRDLASGERR